MKKFEYKVVVVKIQEWNYPEELVEKLNFEGKDGWELMEKEHWRQNDWPSPTTVNFNLLFKREIDEDNG